MDAKLPNTSQLVWLITGCSSGFGKVFVPALVARGDLVIATARDISTLQDFSQQENVKLLQLDVTSYQETLDQKANKAINLFGRIDVVVNNAGYVQSGVWEEISHEQLLSQFHTNVFGPLNLTRSFLPHMRSRGRGTIVFMSSISAWLGVAAGGPYSASKFALEGAVESLQKEVSPLGINTLLVVLGQFRTNILSSDRRRLQRPVPHISQYDDAVETLSSRQAQTNGKQPGDPALAVEAVLDAVRREGKLANEDSVPFRIVLGSDALEIVRNECSGVLMDLEKHEWLARSTDIPGAHTVQDYK